MFFLIKFFNGINKDWFWVIFEFVKVFEFKNVFGKFLLVINIDFLFV